MATLGITVPDNLVPRVMGAFRAMYPDLTGDAAGMTPLNDGPAARAVIKHMVRQVVQHHEGNQVRQTQTNQATQAEQQAWADTDGIT